MGHVCTLVQAREKMYGLDNRINIGAPERREEVVLTWWMKMIDIHCSCELWEKKISMFSIYGETLPEFYSYFCNSAQPPIEGPNLVFNSS